MSATVPLSRDEEWAREARNRWKYAGWLPQLLMRCGGRVWVRDENLVPENPNNKAVGLYLFYCDAKRPNGTRHGPQMSYKQGYEEELRCPLCEQRRLQGAALCPSLRLVI